MPFFSFLSTPHHHHRHHRHHLTALVILVSGAGAIVPSFHRSRAQVILRRELLSSCHGCWFGAEALKLRYGRRKVPTSMIGADAKRRVSVALCKPCANPHNGNHDMPQFLPDELSRYLVLHNNRSKSPLYDVTVTSCQGQET